MLEVGQPAPDFTLPDQAGNPVSLKALRGKPVVLYFYPKDDTPGCTKEACSFRDHWKTLEARGIAVLGISPDSQASHAKFAGKYSLPFTLLADTERAVANLYGTYGEKTLYGKKSMGILRTTFLIDAEGVVQHVWKKPKTDVHAEEVLAKFT
ncbi:MAG: Peroxiredoxin [Cyanobacteria bacterium RYN_339]|nr:Peroxiredoxin [Cyanobacteria bacterium RYN_339]